MTAAARGVLAAAVLAAAFAGSTAAAASYEPMGEQKPASTVKHDDYRFDVVPPTSTYANLPWQRYRDTGDDGSTILLTGMSGYDSYAISVLTVADAAGATDPVALAAGKYPDEAFALHPGNTACAVNDLSSPPMPLGPGMVAYVAECIHPESGHAYELVVSWRSMLLRASEMGMDGVGNCGGDSDDDTACLPKFAELRAAMDTFVSSFEFRD